MKKAGSIPDRQCRYIACGKTFSPQKMWQFYCTENHHDLEWARRKVVSKQDSQSSREVSQDGK